MIGSIRSYAKHRGCSPTNVRRLIAKGKITALPDGRIDFDQADRDYDVNVLPRRRRGAAAQRQIERPVEQRRHCGVTPAGMWRAPCHRVADLLVRLRGQWPGLLRRAVLRHGGDERAAAIAVASLGLMLGSLEWTITGDNEVSAPPGLAWTPEAEALVNRILAEPAGAAEGDALADAMLGVGDEV